ncbi:hypothetical protein BaRGS_00005753 [Batillaria attramentaria]|uniref:Uncharacterized protein n=1 Tax=Batillaria attramentaria TaxID=370345 RepID=A0ABD0LVY3_9CAEN
MVWAEKGTPRTATNMYTRFWYVPHGLIDVTISSKIILTNTSTIPVSPLEHTASRPDTETLTIDTTLPCLFLEYSLAFFALILVPSLRKRTKFVLTSLDSNGHLSSNQVNSKNVRSQSLFLS